MIAGPDRKEMWQFQVGMAAGEGVLQDAWASRTGLSQMAALICNEVQKILQGEPSHLEGRMFITNLRTLTNSSHFFLPDPLCPVCSPIPDDTSESAKSG